MIACVGPSKVFEHFVIWSFVLSFFSLHISVVIIRICSYNSSIMEVSRKNPGVGVRMSREVKEACEKINWGKVEEILVVRF